MSLLTALYMIQFLLKIIRTMSFNAYGVGYVIGFLIFSFLLCWFCYWLIKAGLRFTKQKEAIDLQEKIESIR